jgi:hypothetical protein
MTFFQKNDFFLIPSAFLFLIDISSKAVQIGLTQQMIASIRSLLSNISDESYVGLMTMSNTIVYYNLHELNEHVFADLDDLSAPIQSLSLMKNSRQNFLSALDLIESRCYIKPLFGHCIGSVFRFAVNALQKFSALLIVGFTGFPAEGH